jgi:hypothetical protein
MIAIGCYLQLAGCASKRKNGCEFVPSVAGRFKHRRSGRAASPERGVGGEVLVGLTLSPSAGRGHESWNGLHRDSERGGHCQDDRRSSAAAGAGNGTDPGRDAVAGAVSEARSRPGAGAGTRCWKDPGRVGVAGTRPWNTPSSWRCRRRGTLGDSANGTVASARSWMSLSHHDIASADSWNASERSVAAVAGAGTNPGNAPSPSPALIQILETRRRRRRTSGKSLETRRRCERRDTSEEH